MAVIDALLSCCGEETKLEVETNKKKKLKKLKCIYLWKKY